MRRLTMVLTMAIAMVRTKKQVAWLTIGIAWFATASGKPIDTPISAYLLFFQAPPLIVNKINFKLSSFFFVCTICTQLIIGPQYDACRRRRISLSR